MMLSSMFSPTKKDDQEMLLEIAETIEMLVKIGTAEAWDLAEKFGQDYLQLETRIKTYDYSKEDEIDARIEARLKHENNPSLRND